MNATLIYRPRRRWLTWIAFGCAVAIHLTAIGLAANKSKPEEVGSIPDSFDPAVVGIEDNPPPQEQEVMPPESPVVSENNEFSDEIATPRPMRLRKKMPITPIARSIGTGKATRPGSVKSLTLYAPKPNYPYEARRGGTTGSGVVQLTVNFDAGNVIDARMAQSTGSTILDTATIEALRRWRFKPGAVETVSVPITFTLSGVSY